MSAAPILSLQNVWVEYGDKIVLEKVDLDIQPGLFVSIVGRSCPRMTRSRLDLPAPEGPTIETNNPGWMSRSTFSSTIL